MKLTLTLLLLISYAYTFIRYALGWIKTPESSTPQKEDLFKIKLLKRDQSLNYELIASLVICFHNEELHIPALLQSIDLQKYKIKDICFINDHSTDKSVEMLSAYCRTHENAHLYHSKEKGKKAALSYGIPLAQEATLLLTDADCRFTKEWSSSLAYALNSEDSKSMIIGGVKYKKENSLWFENIDFASLIATTGGAAYYSPILCNGANICTYRNLWLTFQTELKRNEISGDDIFYLQALKKEAYKIEFLKDYGSFVETDGEKTWKGFIKQRRRWGSKTTSYQDAHILWVALIVGLISCAQLYTIFTLQLNIYLLISIVKLSVDCTLIIPFLRDTNQKKLIKYILPFAILYPFYIFGIAISSMIQKPKSW